MAYQIKGEGFVLGVDRPAKGYKIREPGFLLCGWVATTNKPIDQFRVIGPAGLVTTLRREERPDVSNSIQGQHVMGFTGTISIEFLDQQGMVRLEFNEDHVMLDIEVDPEVLTSFLLAREKKRKTIMQLVGCRECQKGEYAGEGSEWSCTNCGVAVRLANGIPDFRPLELAEDIGNEASPISSNSYDQAALDIIRDPTKKIILDNGAGLRNRYFEHVVNLEIVDLPTTDVLGVGEALPFKNEVFDAIFSLAVLEHVKDPFKCVQEMERVLKPGGKIYAAVPFLQPFHGYPDHYYNMTANGLKNLFSSSIEIVESGIPAAGTPIWSLSWFLNSYVNGLSLEAAEKFKKMRVEELMAPAITQLDEEYVFGLSEHAQLELASVNYVIAKKKPRT